MSLGRGWMEHPLHMWRRRPGPARTPEARRLPCADNLKPPRDHEAQGKTISATVGTASSCQVAAKRRGLASHDAASVVVEWKETKRAFGAWWFCEGGGWGGAPILGELAHEHLVELGLEHAIGAELPLLGDLGGHGWSASDGQKAEQVSVTFLSSPGRHWEKPLGGFAMLSTAVVSRARASS